MSALGSLFGMAVYENPHCKVWTQVRFPRSRKKRMRKKWVKQDKNFEWRPGAYMISGGLHAHPVIIQELRTVG